MTWLYYMPLPIVFKILLFYFSIGFRVYIVFLWRKCLSTLVIYKWVVILLESIIKYLKCCIYFDNSKCLAVFTHFSLFSLRNFNIKVSYDLVVFHALPIIFKIMLFYYSIEFRVYIVFSWQKCHTKIIAICHIYKSLMKKYQYCWL